MAPADVKAFVDTLQRRGLAYSGDGTAKDLIVVDQLRGPVAGCDWIEFGQISLGGDPQKRVSACRLKGSTQSVVVTPDDWTFEQSLSANPVFVPNEDIEKRLTVVRNENGLDVYRDKATGKEVFIGRAADRLRQKPGGSGT
jgi:hypothetical protein